MINIHVFRFSAQESKKILEKTKKKRLGFYLYAETIEGIWHTLKLELSVDDANFTHSFLLCALPTYPTTLLTARFENINESRNIFLKNLTNTVIDVRVIEILE